jgi:hypothetical protein
MNGYGDFSAGSQYTFDTQNGSGDDKFESVQSGWQHLQSQQLQFHGYDQSSTGMLYIIVVEEYSSSHGSNNIHRRL